MSNKKIILVDDNQANLVACKETLQELFDIYPVISAEKMFELLKNVIPDLILLDVDMPEMNGYEALRQLKSNDVYKRIPVIFLTAMDDYRSEIEGLNLGAVDYITKPFISANLIRRVEKHLVINDGKRELAALNDTINALLGAQAEEDGEKAQTLEATIGALQEKINLLTSLVHAMHIPLLTLIERMQTAMELDRTGSVNHCLSIADTEAALLLEIVNNILEENSNYGQGS